jgi:RES domain-containing protein
MQLWRICRRHHAKRAYDGKGARRFGGRWNRPGDALVYASPTLSLAALEVFVNMVEPPDAPDDYVSVTATLPDDVSVERWEADSLPPNWADPAPPRILQHLGSEWVHSLRTAVLLVPSVVIRVEFNVLLNPAHADCRQLKVGRSRPFQFDARLWNQGPLGSGM